MSYWGNEPIDNDFAFDQVGSYIYLMRELKFPRNSGRSKKSVNYSEEEQHEQRTFEFEPQTYPPAEFKEWIQNHQNLPVTDLKNDCIQSLRRVLSEDSELSEIWSDSGEDYQGYKIWRSNIDEMIKIFQS